MFGFWVGQQYAIQIEYFQIKSFHIASWGFSREVTWKFVLNNWSSDVSHDVSNLYDLLSIGIIWGRSCVLVKYNNGVQARKSHVIFSVNVLYIEDKTCITVWWTMPKLHVSWDIFVIGCNCVMLLKLSSKILLICITTVIFLNIKS